MSETTARKYFGKEEAIGKTVSFTGWVNDTYTVTGVFKDVPATSHIQFDVLPSSFFDGFNQLLERMLSSV